MRIVETDADNYDKVVVKPPHVYNGVEFSELNRHKVDDVHYLLFEDRKMRFGIVLGESDGKLMSPFSAPYGGFSVVGKQHIRYFGDAVRALRDYGERKSKHMVITLPPLCYGYAQQAEWINAMASVGKNLYVDVNYHFDVSLFQTYLSIIERNARKNLHRSLTEGFSFAHFDGHDEQGLRRAYEVIRINREEHQYNLSMALDDVLATTEKVVDADYFVLTHDNVDVAAAQVFHVTQDIVQVIYWGDKKKYSFMRSMNMLAYGIFEYYHKKGGVRLIDIGPSTQNGRPNPGLCDFKMAVGCDTSPKFCFEI